jgi:hypothetical protein
MSGDFLLEMSGTMGECILLTESGGDAKSALLKTVLKMFGRMGDPLRKLERLGDGTGDGLLNSASEREGNSVEELRSGKEVGLLGNSGSGTPVILLIKHKSFKLV